MSSDVLHLVGITKQIFLLCLPPAMPSMDQGENLLDRAVEVLVHLIFWHFGGMAIVIRLIISGFSLPKLCCFAYKNKLTDWVINSEWKNVHFLGLIETENYEFSIQLQYHFIDRKFDENPPANSDVLKLCQILYISYSKRQAFS